MFYCNFLYLTVLPDPSISTVCFLTQIPSCAPPWYATPTTTVIEYALSHSIGINVANVGLKCRSFGFVKAN